LRHGFLFILQDAKANMHQLAHSSIQSLHLILPLPINLNAMALIVGLCCIATMAALYSLARTFGLPFLLNAEPPRKIPDSCIFGITPKNTAHSPALLNFLPRITDSTLDADQ
jgi:hypothetical protein